jgi:hypothetical protein
MGMLLLLLALDSITIPSLMKTETTMMIQLAALPLKFITTIMVTA